MLHKHLRFIAVFLTAILMAMIIETSHAQGQESGQPELRMPEFIAHRGASRLAPENTMASIQLAWEMDVDAVEIDIYLTADDEIVVFHDRNTNRITGRDRMVEDQTLEELRELDYGAWKALQWEDEQIPTLAEAIATLPKGKRIFVEAKSDIRIVEPMLEEFDKIEHYPHQIVVIAFSYEVAAKTKKLRPRTPVYLLDSFSRNEETGQWTPSMDEVVERALEANLDGVNLSFIGPATVAESVAMIREAGLGYYVWTINDLDDAQRALELNVDGLTTDRPVWIKKQLLSRNGRKLLSGP